MRTWQNVKEVFCHVHDVAFARSRYLKTSSSTRHHADHAQCDRALPQCQQCRQAKAECTGFNSKQGGKDVPRSVVQHLESEIARLENELAHNGHLDDLNASDILAGMPLQDQQPPPLPDFNEPPKISTEPSPVFIARDEVRERIMASAEIQASVSATLPVGPGLTDLVSHVRMGLTPSSAINSDARRQRHSRRSSIKRQDNRCDATIFRTMPPHIVHSLVRKWMQRMLPTYPVLHEPTVWQQVEDCLRLLSSIPSDQKAVIEPSYDFLTIYLIMAISSTLGAASSGHEARCLQFSAQLFEEGIQHMSSHARMPTYLAGLQSTLLALQYATINPRSANVWILSGAAMRSCLELGLHREPCDNSLDPLTLDLRRRIFWSAYCQDRSICSTLQRPLSIPERAIDSHFPSLLDDEYIKPNGIDQSGKLTKIHLLRWIQFRQLQAAMIEVHFQNKPLDLGQSWEDWLVVMETRLRKWYREYADAHELSDFTLHHGMVNLHRPSPRVPLPSPHSLTVAFEAASGSAKALRDHIGTGFYRRPWHLAHFTLESSMIVLFCLRHASESISARWSTNEIFEMTKVFTSNFLSIAAQGWTEVSNYASIYEKLLGPLLEAIFSGKPVTTSFGPAQDAELTRLLYPGPAQIDKLRFGSQEVLAAAQNSASFDQALYNWEDTPNADGMGTADYAGQWDLLDHSHTMDEQVGPIGLEVL